MNSIDEKYNTFTDLELINEMSKRGDLKIPKAIEEILDAKILHDTVVDVDKMESQVMKILDK